MDKSKKQEIINEVTNTFKHKQWFNGAGFEPNSDKLTIAYNYYPAFELVEIKSNLYKFGVEYEFKDIREILPNSQKDDRPPYIK